MGTLSATDITKPVAGIAQTVVLCGTVDLSASGQNITPATGDLLIPLKLPAGFKCSAVLANVRTAFGATAPSSVGISHTDGSTPSQATPEQLVTATGDTTFASTGMKTLLPRLGAFTTDKEANLLVTFGTLGTPAKGVADFVAIGEFVGSK